MIGLVQRALDLLAPVARDGRTVAAAWAGIWVSLAAIPKPLVEETLAVWDVVIFVMVLADLYGYDPLIDDDRY